MTPRLFDDAVPNAARPAEERAELLAWMKGRLREEYGERPLDSRRDPMHELISTILGSKRSA